MRAPVPISIVLTISALATACANPTARESTIHGTAALSTFPCTPSVVTARAESGSASNAAVDAQGNFALPLPKGHTYRISFDGSGIHIPLVFPRATGRVDATFFLNTNAAALRVGNVRHYAGVPAGGFHVLVLQAPVSTLPSSAGSTGECTDCVNDDESLACVGSGSDSESKAPASPAAEDDTAEQADAASEFAVGDQNLPADISGCDNRDDNVEQEGEH